MDTVPEIVRSIHAPRRRGLGAVTVALLAAGLYGMPVGALTGACAAVWYFFVGAVFGGIYGIPVGFLAALLGAAMGGRWGFRIAGVLGGFIGGALITGVFPGLGDAQTARYLGGFAPVLTASATVGGFVAGYIVDRAMRYPGPPGGGLNRWLYRKLHGSGLYAWPLWVRLLMAVGNLLALAAVGAELHTASLAFA